MEILKNSCCGCCNIRAGSIFVGVLFANLHLTDLSLKAMSIRPGSQVYGLPAAGIAIDVLAILMCALMIHGVQKGKRVMLLVWVVFVVIILVVKLIIAIAITVLVTIAAEVAARSYFFRYVNISAIPIEEIEAKILAQVWAIYIVTLLLTICGVLVVYSHYQNLRYGVLDDDGMMVQYRPLAPSRPVLQLPHLEACTHKHRPLPLVMRSSMWFHLKYEVLQSQTESSNKTPEEETTNVNLHIVSRSF
ncbi:uncharacterized protein LOC144925612 isoform X1 [Branchiostoma floridae x Branchiostoma belcheri]